MSTPSIRRFALSAACILALAGQAAVAAPPAVSGKPGPQPGGGYLHADGFLSKGDMLVYVGTPRAAEAPAQAAATPAPQPASAQADRIAVSERSRPRLPAARASSSARSRVAATCMPTAS